MVRKLEAAFEIPVGNTEVQEIAIVVAVDLLLAGNNQQVLLSSDIDFIGLETGDCDGHDIFGFRGPLDIEGRIVIALGCGARVFQEVEQAIKANGRAAIRGKVKTVHVKFSCLSNLVLLKARMHGAFVLLEGPSPAPSTLRWIVRNKNQGRPIEIGRPD